MPPRASSCRFGRKASSGVLKSLDTHQRETHFAGSKRFVPFTFFAGVLGCEGDVSSIQVLGHGHKGGHAWDTPSFQSVGETPSPRPCCCLSFQPCSESGAAGTEPQSSCFPVSGHCAVFTLAITLHTRQHRTAATEPVGPSCVSNPSPSPAPTSRWESPHTQDLLPSVPEAVLQSSLGSGALSRLPSPHSHRGNSPWMPGPAGPRRWAGVLGRGAGRGHWAGALGTGMGILGIPLAWICPPRPAGPRHWAQASWRGPSSLDTPPPTCWAKTLGRGTLGILRGSLQPGHAPLTCWAKTLG